MNILTFIDSANDDAFDDFFHASFPDLEIYVGCDSPIAEVCDGSHAAVIVDACHMSNDHWIALSLAMKEFTRNDSACHVIIYAKQRSIVPRCVDSHFHFVQARTYIEDSKLFTVLDACLHQKPLCV